MKKFFESRLGETAVLLSTSFFHLFFTLIAYSLGLIGRYKGASIWGTASFYTNRPVGSYFCVAFIALFILDIILSAIGVALFFIKKKKLGFYVLIPFNLLLSLFILFVHFRYKMLGGGAIACLVFSILISIVGFVYLIYTRIMKEEVKEEKITKEQLHNIKLYKRILLIFEWASLGILFTIFFIPVYVTEELRKTTSYFLISAMGTNTSVVIYVFFIVFFLAFLSSLLYLISIFPYYYKSDKEYIRKSKLAIIGNISISLVFFLVGYFMTFYTKIKGGAASTISFIPILLMVVLYIAFSVIQGKIGIEFEEDDRVEKENTFKLEPLIFVAVLTCITLTSLFFNIIEIHASIGLLKSDVVLNGFKLLTTYQNLSGGYQGLAFALFAFLLISGILLVLTIVSFFARYKDYYRVVKVSAFANVIFMLLLGLYGFYFKIAQKINEDNIKSLLEYYNIAFIETYKYKIYSQMIYVFLASLVVLILMIVRGQLNYKTEDEKNYIGSAFGSGRDKKSKPILDEPTVEFDFDACPAFTELDSKLEIFKSELENRRAHLFENLTLPNLVRFVVDYARESRLHLSYSLEDIATFVAGLGASRLTILQGMSGTGKTSLPKIFAEAIMGNCEVVEVESSWRDKNELLGYYNEFSKCFTPKKFTQCLYKARLNAEVPTFIVLDEMNLSRIEYYFSDFLSLMEHEEHMRKIKLLNIKLYRTLNHEQLSYYGLTEGHTIEIPTNVWFIGTANRDESTFEISDKVYDRAQTMNFNKRAPKIHSFSEPLDQRFVTYDLIAKLFAEAKESYSFEAEDDKIIQKVEKLLAPYNISFGNRILKQMEDFVKIYCACFGDKDAVLKDAVEKIVLSKVVSKLEYKIVENKEALAVEFDKLGLTACSAFVRKLNED
ncbi:MAG: AAA family ATPase [Anaeroplasmataceae bacterium]|nr:AAA family ATPase [Anaeroplasmataceae bacterium]